ncbi:MAG TPA: hypothetical protein VLI90_12075 [Tepidisphaeraceae bacterium]|nr:hypothetical protein [Tepidisphaeraceae bacterium]
MRHSSAAAFVLLTLGMLLSGCGSQEGETVFTAGPNNAEVVGKAPHTGTYLLFTAASPNPTTTVNLNEGDPMGFHKTADGKIQAFWKDQTYDFDKATAQVYWKYKKS